MTRVDEYKKHECPDGSEHFILERTQVDGEWGWRLNIRTAGVNLIFSVDYCPFCGSEVWCK